MSSKWGGGPVQPGSHLRSGAGLGARWPCSHGHHRAHNLCHPSCGFWVGTEAGGGVWGEGGGGGSFLLGMVGNFSSSTRPGQGYESGVENYFFTVWKRRWKEHKLRKRGPLARKTLPEPGARGPGFERGGLAPPAGLHGAEGPCRGELVGEEGPAAAGGGGEAVFRYRGGSEEGPGPSVSSAGPRPGVLCPLGGGTFFPAPSVCQSGHTGSCWPSPPI